MEIDKTYLKEQLRDARRYWDSERVRLRGTTYWIHFAVRPSGNRRKILFDCR